ncbi:MAG: HD family phosphohydrolase, partial [Planctomycetota bacterium]
HHGTTLAEYFYRRAMENDENPVDSVYRYAGPKPQTKEAAIVLLADTVEAASRALGHPSVARLKAMVHDLANRRLLDGQFDESGLTLRDLAAVEASFTRILISMFHARVAYPEAPDKKRKNGAAKS